ncbi:hypothetical protein [Vitiosangium sp. GDMCC 1.1324]|uniref:hypothetical protein n=1 Tax=Vitiosangium sp. (strain GDMCC 1.1324) TaxID=2138576 RepID=UPI000D3476A6|nr:hypothetical protein [Vitiosangium sp. GDMCC 1.1324]PTL77098.1 hypothetical protein DAT35_46520 [Vitiosangium sp. GDMCC 1.1324]
MRLFPAAVVLTLSTVLSACSGPQSFCTLEARASVQVRVVDARGTPQRDARVTFTRDGGPEQQAMCAGAGTQGNCDTWVTEYERPGEYVITATSADGQRTARQSVSVGEDECHVLTETVTLTLPD